MQTSHQVLFHDARAMTGVSDEAVELIVTSPPYPMIEMWDEVFAQLNDEIATALAAHDGNLAFELMHQELDKVWRECVRVLKPGGIICLNIGDAVRTVGDEFQMYSNHSRIVQALREFGLTQLPDILWRKPTNAPNKFMGSGMLPAGAYVTYEHEYILIFRKGSRRAFKTEEEKHRRRTSAFFWEERNRWFSDLWANLQGAQQGLNTLEVRPRSAAYPFELAYRLLCMYSIYGDTVLDPFLGTGTTIAAAIVACRNSIGIEMEEGLADTINQTIENAVSAGSAHITNRLWEHQKSICARIETGVAVKYQNLHHHFGVVTAQEVEAIFYIPSGFCSPLGNNFKINYEMAGQEPAPQVIVTKRIKPRQQSRGRSSGKLLVKSSLIN